MSVPSKSRVDRAGKRLRDHQRGIAPLTGPEHAFEIQVVEGFRAAHGEPMMIVAAQLRRLVAIVSGGGAEVGQRLKRMATILDKLDRQPTMALSRMQDIAGCRAVVPTQATADSIVERLRAEPDRGLLSKSWDYVAAPKPDGYRAKHLVAVADGFRVEVRVRTAAQHAWAELVESLDRELGSRAKFGAPGPPLGSALIEAAEAAASYDRGELDLDAMMDQLAFVKRFACSTE